MSAMGSSRLWGKITVLIAVCGWCLSAQAKYDGGSGTEAEPYRISAVSDWQELMATPADWASHFILTSDIELDGVSITPIAPDTSASYEFQGVPFTGIFDGNDYVIRNVDVNTPGRDYVGLFGYLGTDGQIKNLRVEDTSILGRDYVGGLAARNRGTVSDCYSTGSVSGNRYVGGLVGHSSVGTIANCYSTGSVSGDRYVGGLAGHNEDATITNCYSAGSVNGGLDVGGLVGENWWGTISNSYSSGSVNGGLDVGGLVGENYDEGIVTNCYSTASVTGEDYVGGLVAFNSRSTITNSYSTGSVTGEDVVGGLSGCTDGTVANCYSSGLVTGDFRLGGLVGWYHGVIRDSFWDVNTSGSATSDGGTPKTTAEMKTESTFTSAGWDFIGVWDIGENQTYPFLRTYPAGDINHDGAVDFRDVAHLAESWLRSK